jgi:predicted nucleic acid-binding protein
VARTKSALTVVCDAGPLIHLDELDCLTLLDDFDQVLIPKQVWQEVEHQRPEALVRPDLGFEEIEVNISTQATFQTLAQALSLDLVNKLLWL